MSRSSCNFGMIRHWLGFGVAAFDTLSDLFDAEAFFCLSHAQATQRPDAQSQRPFRRHATGINLLARRHGGGLAHRRRQVQQPFVAEGLASVRLWRLLDLVKLLENPDR